MTALRSRLHVWLLALATLSLVSVSIQTASLAGAQPPSGSLLLFDATEQQLSRIDAATLAPATNASPVTLGTRVTAWDLARSADGSTLVSLDNATRGVIAVRDGRTGAERRTIFASLMVDSPRLNADGSRLLVTLTELQASWALYDTATGHLISTYGAPEGWADPASVSADLTRLYYLINMPNEDPANADVVPAPVLVAVDLVAGKEIGRVALPEIGYGAAPAAAQAELDAGEPVHFGIPGLAISPDGRSIAVVRADGSGFTLLDAERLTIERTVAITRPAGAVRRLLTWLSVMPRETAAKGNLVQERRFAVFSPDGQRLFVWGTRQVTEMTEEREVLSGTGLVAIDIARGAVLAQSRGDLLIDHLVPSPDGTSLYVTGPTLGKRLVAWTPNTLMEAFDSTYFVRRLDATSLNLLAAREFSDAAWIAPIQARTED